MDTFDALGAKYDHPLNIQELNEIAKKVGFINFEIKKNGPVIVLNAVK